MENEKTIDKAIAELIVAVRDEIKKKLPETIPENREERRKAMLDIMATTMATTETFLSVMLRNDKKLIRKALELWVERLDDEIKNEKEDQIFGKEETK